MNIACFWCRKKVADGDHFPQCRHCGCDVGMLHTITSASYDSLLLSLEALREGRDRDAHEFAYESWGLRHSVEAAAAGLLAAIALGDPIEIPRWIRRRRAVAV